jgi:hypothetical protein
MTRKAFKCIIYELGEVFETTFRLFVSIFDSLHITASLSQNVGMRF